MNEPFATGNTNRRLNAIIRAREYPDLFNGSGKTGPICLLRALCSLADWQTGVIPYQRHQMAEISGLNPGTVSRWNARFEKRGLLIENWRTSRQVQYRLSDVFRG